MKMVRSRKEDCCGCTACMHRCPEGAIRMEADSEGFLYPMINQNLCTDCGLCREICPFHTFDHRTGNFKEPKVYAAKHADLSVRNRSASGGAFTALSDAILSQGGVIYGALLDEGLKVRHGKAETPEERDAMRGSKYVQSELEDIFIDVEKEARQGRKVLFTGTPCQNAGLAAFLGNEVHPELFFCDLICHGTPTQMLFHEFLAHSERVSRDTVVGYIWRSKSLGGHRHIEETRYKSGKKDHKSFLSQINKDLFYSHLALRPACYHCHFTKTSRISDVTLADFWGVEDYMPDFCDGEGISLVLINSSKGESLFNDARKDMEVRESCLQECTPKNSHLLKPTVRPIERDEFWADYHSFGFEFILRKFFGYTFWGRIKKNVLIPVLRKAGLLETLRALRKRKKNTQ